MMGKLYTYDNTGLTFVVDAFQAEYAGCGSHQIELRLDFGIDELNEFLKQLGIEPVSPTEHFPPKPNKEEASHV